MCFGFKKNLFFLTILFAFNFSAKAQIPSTCFEIESILVDGCDGSNEGKNEMVRFVVGSTPLDVANLSVNWPNINNTWLDVVQNATTAAGVAAINSTIHTCGGYVKEPPGGILPAGAKVILITSELFNPTAQSFINLSDTVYVIFQTQGNIAGHFKNYSNPGVLRTLTMSFSSPAGCADAVTYNTGSLTTQTGAIGAEDGATVEFDWSGNATYINNGCQAPFVPLIVNAGPSSTICSSSVNLTGSFSGTIGGATLGFIWFGGAGTFSNPTSTTTTYTPAPTETGRIILSFGVIQVCNDTLLDTVSINITSPLAPIVSGSTISYCVGDVASSLSATGTNLLWYTTAIGGVGSTTAPTPLTASPGTTNYYVSQTITGCESSRALIEVIINSSVLVNAGLNDSICFGTNTLLVATPGSGGYTYNWLPAVSLSNSSIANPFANPLTTTTYTLSVINNANGCSGVDSLTVFVDLPLSSTLSVINVKCNGACNGQATANSVGGLAPYNYSWSNGEITPTITGLCPNSYTITTTDLWGCSIVSDTSITEPAALVSSINTSTIPSCSGSCDGTATASATGGTIGYTYTWDTFPIQHLANVTGLCSGTYICTITDNNSCTDTSSIIILQPPPVVIAPIANIIICSGGNATLVATATGGNGGLYNYSWDKPGTPAFATGSSISVSPTTVTTYTVNVSDVLFGCPALPITVTVSLNTALTVLANGPISVCSGDVATLTALATGGGGGPYTYTWAPSGLGTAIQVSPTSNTTYTVTATDGCGSTDTDIRTISVIPAPIPNFVSANTTGCAPLCTRFIDASSVATGSISSWKWNFGDGSSDSTSQNPFHCYSLAGMYSVSLSVKSSNGCSSSLTYTNMINAKANPVADFKTTPNSTSLLEPNVTFNDQSTGGANYWLWNFGDGVSLSFFNPNPTHTYPSDMPGTYNAQLIVRNTDGCYDTTTQDIVVNPVFTFYIPNAFSPNEDGKNDVFKSKGVGIKEFEIYIFDRWGNMIFYADDINKGWDGKTNNGLEISQEEVYVYKVRLRDVYDEIHKYIGSITIVK